MGAVSRYHRRYPWEPLRFLILHVGKKSGDITYTFLGLQVAGRLLFDRPRNLDECGFVG